MDVEAYLRRIEYRGFPDIERPSVDLLRALHRAHLFTVPFENLDIPLGRNIICDEGRILHKIVNKHRGGFCYELNGAFAALLRAVGFKVTLLSGRVAAPDKIGPEFDHLTLRVDLEEPWLADVGFGDCFVEPLRLQLHIEQPQNGRVYRLQSSSELHPGSSTASDAVVSLQVMADGKWKTEYALTLRPRELADFASMCHYHQTSPESHFTRQRICSMAAPDGRITLADDKLIETRGGMRKERMIANEEEWRAQLSAKFGILLPEPLPKRFFAESRHRLD